MYQVLQTTMYVGLGCAVAAALLLLIAGVASPARLFYPLLSVIVIGLATMAVSGLARTETRLDALEQRYGVELGGSAPSHDLRVLSVDGEDQACRTRGAFPTERLYCGSDLVELPLAGSA